MKYLLLDIDDTISPWSYKGRDAIFIDRMGIKLGIPKHLADWLAKLSDDEIKIIWCTSRPAVVRSLIEKKIMFKTYGHISFLNQHAYAWYKLFGIIKFCDEHKQDLVILADNDIEKGIKGITNLPNNLKLISPSDTIRGCLSKEDLKLIDSL